MSYYCRKEEVQENYSGYGHGSFRMLGSEQGCTNGCCAGISYYSMKEYTPPAIHEDQEGFLVLSGSGWVKIGEEEFRVDSETAFIVPAKMCHQMKSISSEIPLTVFWFHANA